MMDADDTAFKKTIPNPAGPTGTSGLFVNGAEEDWLALANQ